MKRRLLLGGLALAMAWSAGCGNIEINAPDWPDWHPDDPPDAERVTTTWRGQIAPGNHIEIKGVYGAIHAVRTAGTDVVVTATRIGDAEAVANVHIDVVPHSSGVTVCAVYPDVPGQSPNSCQPGDAGNLSVWDGGRGVVRVAFLVEVPDGVDLMAKTVTGSIEATGLHSDVFAQTVFGNVVVTTTGLATATTVTGSITATIGLADWDRSLQFTTTSGDVTVTIPGSTNAEVRATAVSGDISSDFPLRPSSAGDMRGTIGSGGPLLTLTTLAGDVTLRRGS